MPRQPLRSIVTTSARNRNGEPFFGMTIDRKTNTMHPRRASGTTRHPLALALSLALAAMAPAVGAATIQVTTADDAGTISTCTFRQAIASMNAAAVGASSSCLNSGASFGTGDTITFAPAVTTVALADTANNELLVTDSNLTIAGSGLGGVTISRISGATNAFRIFHDTGTTGASFEETLYLSGLTLENGATLAASAGGGAILMAPPSYTTARLKLTNCIISGNSTNGTEAVGGAIAGTGSAATHSGTVVTLTGSTVNDNATGGGSAGGGAIYAATVTLKNSIVTGNSTAGTSSPGGAILAVDAIMNNSTLSHNSTAESGSPGGGIAAQSTRYAIGGFSGSYNVISYNTTSGLQSPGGGVYAASTNGTLSNEIITNNSTAGSSSNGGGIYVASYYGVNFASSTISDNTVTGPSSSGGGIWSRFGKGAVKQLLSSTISGNSATLEGGGISLNVCASVAATALSIYNSTIAFNSTAAAGGGGVYVGNVGCPAGDVSKPTSAALIVTSSILANTSSASAGSSDLAAQAGFALTVHTSFDLIQILPSAGGITLVNAGGSPPVISRAPLLGDLADNGCGKEAGAPGATACVPTHAIACRSPAYNAGSNPLTDTFDERGTGFPRMIGSTTDIGAYEFSYTANGDNIFCDGFESYP